MIMAEQSCERVKALLEAKEAAELPAELQAHLRRCSECRAAVDDRRIADALAALPVAPPSEDFAGRVFNAATAAQPGDRSLGWSPALAAAAMVLLGAACLLLRPTGPIDGDGATVAVPATTAERPAQVVRVLIDTADPRERARLTVDLGDRFELEGFAGQRRVEWDTRLLPGQNLLELPVRPLSTGSGEIRISLSYDGTVQQQLQVPIDAG